MSILFCTFAIDKELIHSKLTFHVEHEEHFDRLRTQTLARPQGNKKTMSNKPKKKMRIMSERTKIYVVKQATIENVNYGLNIAKSLYGKSRWEDVELAGASASLFAVSTKEQAVRRCRQYNKKQDSIARSQIYYFLELQNIE